MFNISKTLFAILILTVFFKPSLGLSEEVTQENDTKLTIDSEALKAKINAADSIITSQARATFHSFNVSKIVAEFKSTPSSENPCEYSSVSAGSGLANLDNLQWLIQGQVEKIEFIKDSFSSESEAGALVVNKIDQLNQMTEQLNRAHNRIASICINMGEKPDFIKGVNNLLYVLKTDVIGVIEKDSSSKEPSESTSSTANENPPPILLNLIPQIRGTLD